VTGQAVDTATVILIAFWGTPWRTIGSVIFWSYVTKVIYETLATPVTYVVVAWLKRIEQVDAFDGSTNFNPFRLRV
jgi:hypothetical protein